MTVSRFYDSPLGNLLLTADEIGLTELRFVPESAACTDADAPVLAETAHWLDLYFSGLEPDFMPPLHPVGTPFRQTVWSLLEKIPYGQTVTYGELAGQAAEQLGRRQMSAQAIGGAVGHNPISILLPCHRVVGASGHLTGYAGGLDKKIFLLSLEGVDTDRFAVP